MRTNKWSATVALVSLLLAGGTLTDPAKARTAGAQTGSHKIDKCRNPEGDCACDERDSGKPFDD